MGSDLLRVFRHFLRIGPQTFEGNAIRFLSDIKSFEEFPTPFERIGIAFEKNVSPFEFHAVRFERNAIR